MSTVSAAADKVLYIRGESGDWLVDLEPESSHAEDIPERHHLYSTLLHRRHNLPVHSVALLLRREANARNLNGMLELRLPGRNDPYDVFRYQVIRLWEEPLARLLAGGLGTLALAPLTDEGSVNLPEVLRVIDERLRQEAPPPRAAKIWAGVFVLMGLRYPAELSETLFQGVKTMKPLHPSMLLLQGGRVQHGNGGAAHSRSSHAEEHYRDPSPSAPA